MLRPAEAGQVEMREGDRDAMDDKRLIEVEDLRVHFPLDDRTVKAVDGVSWHIDKGETLAVVGESGSGKSVTAMALMRLTDNAGGHIPTGKIMFRKPEGGVVDIVKQTPEQMRYIRGNDISMIFQEPMTSLNPVFTVGFQIAEAIMLHQGLSEEQALNKALEMLKLVRIPEPEKQLYQYPHQLSGGMRQRVMIAMALSCRPSLLIADEPTTALDVTIQAQILDLLRDLQRERSMAIMLITHNLGVVAENADVVCVMYAGRVVEYANVFELFDRPLHPYTRGLFNSIPGLHGRRHRLTTVEEVVGNPEEFRKLEGFRDGVVPWWPETPAEVMPELAPDRNEYCLHEIEPDRWVGCWRSKHLESHASRRPDLAYRRDDRG